MEVRIGVLADFASVTDDQKLNVLGVFRSIFTSQSPPLMSPPFKVILQLEFNSSEGGEKQFKIALADEDGAEMLSISGKLNVVSLPNGQPTLLNQILDFAGISFPNFGEYEFRILLDGITVCTIPLNVIQAPAIPAEL